MPGDFYPPSLYGFFCDEEFKSFTKGRLNTNCVRFQMLGAGGDYGCDIFEKTNNPRFLRNFGLYDIT